MSNTSELAQVSIDQGSKSFAMASRLFPKELRDGANRIYFWCRHCDDVIDEGGGFAELETLKVLTLNIWDKDQKSHQEPFMAFRETIIKYNIPSHYPMELLEGMRMDLVGKSYFTLSELKLYCYRVASTVGLMMCHVMGIYRASALKEAADLGVAMQLTNIARDVKEDFDLGRTYLPLEWLQAEGLTQTNYMKRENREKLFRVIKRLLFVAEDSYQEGLKGLDALSWRSALTILCAARIYREIGREILHIGPAAIDNRTVISKKQKYSIVLSSLATMLVRLPAYLKLKNKVTIQSEWKFL